MAQRGRKSNQAKADEAQAKKTGATGQTERPAPPRGLNAAGKRRWVEIVAAYPGDRWQASDLSLLKDMIVCEQYAADLQKTLKKEGLLVKNRFGDHVEHPAVAVRDRQLKQVLAIQRALRLSPSTRMRPESAKARPAGGAKKKPWES